MILLGRSLSPFQSGSLSQTQTAAKMEEPKNTTQYKNVNNISHHNKQKSLFVIK